MKTDLYSINEPSEVLTLMEYVCHRVKYPTSLCCECAAADQHGAIHSGGKEWEAHHHTLHALQNNDGSMLIIFKVMHIGPFAGNPTWSYVMDK